MQKLPVFRKIFFLLSIIMIVALSGHSQEQFTITSSNINNYCNGTCTLFDVPDLNGNPTAVIFIIPVEVNGINLDPHSICAYYNGKQWSVMNTDNSTMPPGAQFNVQYYVSPDDNHFTQVVTKENLVKNNSYIDHPGLNGNPNARFQFFQNASPNVRGGNINKSEIKTQYDESAGQWFISNTNGKTLDLATGYNISISPGKSSATNAMTIASPVTNSVNTTAFVPGAKPNNSGQRVFMTVVGKTQGTFPGDNNTNKVEVTGFEMEMNSPRDLSSGQASGKRQHVPLMIEKPSGTGSIQFFKALTANEELTTVTFEVYNTSSSGTLVLDSKIVLTSASVSSLKQSLDGQKGMTDNIKLVHHSIECNRGGVTSSDTWPSLN
jgi:type VI secretion system secreted protein Hcp